MFSSGSFTLPKQPKVSEKKKSNTSDCRFVLKSVRICPSICTEILRNAAGDRFFFFEKPIKIRIFHLDCCFVSNFSSNLLFVSGTSVDQSNGCNDITCHAIGVATAVQFQRSRLFYISLKLLFVFYRKS